MLLANFPEYFREIPWQTTGFPISWPNLTVRVGRSLRRLRKREVSPGFAGYAPWLRDKPARYLIDALLLPNNAQHRAFVEPAGDLWRKHLAGEDHTEHIGRYLTLELYLRQVHDGSPRTLEDALHALPDT